MRYKVGDLVMAVDFPGRPLQYYGVITGVHEILNGPYPFIYYSVDWLGENFPTAPIYESDIKLVKALDD